MDEDKIFVRLVEVSTEFPNGFTIKIPGIEYITKGWVVKQKGFESLYGRDGMEKAFKQALETTCEIEGWKDEDDMFFDVVEIFENEEDATKAGKENGQMTIYQIETGRLKWLD